MSIIETFNEQPAPFLVDDISAPEIMISIAWIIVVFQRYRWTKTVLMIVCIGAVVTLLNFARPVLVLIDGLSAGFIIMTGIVLYRDFIEDLNAREKLSGRQLGCEHLRLTLSSFAKGVLAVSVMSSSAYFIARLGAR